MGIALTSRARLKSFILEVRPIGKVLIPIGLPGAGKSRLGRSLEGDVTVYDLDEMTAKLPLPNRGRALQRLLGEMYRNRNRQDTQYLDGLFLTAQEQEDILRELPDDQDVDVHFWEPDRDACAWNDRYRRAVDSVLTIQHSPIDRPDLNRMRQIHSRVSLVTHQTTRKSQLQMFQDRCSLTDRIVSAAWCTGGSRRDLEGERYPLIADATPVRFRELEAVLELVAPDLPFVQFWELWEALVTTEEYEQPDCYSQGFFARYCCGVPDLYEWLRRRQQITDEV